ncbi:FtsX-like permease family protein, partial [Streptomyces sp. NPDC051940]|uniref:ABC transporter permease n=1 Tax=Streptomyces sp. NPDC051940 TaxID=3155675 RepID=UPI003431AD5E
LGVVMLFMLAVALLGPLLARLCAALFGVLLRGGSAPSALAAANSRTNARRLASALTPIVLAMAFTSTLIFMHTSENRAADRQLRAGVTAEHVVTSPAGLPAAAARSAAGADGVTSAVGVLRTSVLVPVGGAGGDRWLQNSSAQGLSTPRVSGVLDLDVRTGSLAALRTGTVALDVNLASSAGVSTGDRVALRLPDGTTARPEVVATYGRGLGLARVTLPRADLTAHVTSAYDSALLVRGGSAADLAALGTVTDARGYAAGQDTERALNSWANYTMAAVLGGFAAVAAANTLVMTVLARRRELGTLRLVGTTRLQVMRMLRWESLLVSAAGLLLGTAIAAATLFPMTRGLTGSAPYVPPLVYAGLAAAVLGLGAAAVTLPGRAVLGKRGRLPG